ncbi:MAG: cytochrome c [Gemmatimonadota bacterium]|nr:cytochrome c [Gemmatimonadota bacterium]
MINIRIRSAFAAVALAALLACGGGGTADEGGAPENDGTTETTGASDGASGIPVEAPSGAVNPQLADRGETLFNQKGCVGCHSIGKGRLTGPDFAEVDTWRDFEWFYFMVANPDSMTRNDPKAKALLQEYMTPMPDLNVQPDEIRALYEYIRAEAPDAGAAAE